MIYRELIVNNLLKKLCCSLVAASSLIAGVNISLAPNWNAIGTNSNTTLSDIKTQLGNNLLQIQNPDGTKTYDVSAPSYITPSFDKFEVGVGYWIQVTGSDSLEFTFSGDDTNTSIDAPPSTPSLAEDNTTTEALSLPPTTPTI
jgi:hypothetical protein